MVQYQSPIINSVPNNRFQYCASGTIGAALDFMPWPFFGRTKMPQEGKKYCKNKDFSCKLWTLKDTNQTKKNCCRLWITLEKTCKMAKMSMAWVLLKLNVCSDQFKLSCGMASHAHRVQLRKWFGKIQTNKQTTTKSFHKASAYIPVGRTDDNTTVKGNMCLAEALSKSPWVHLHVVGMLRFMFDKNQPSLPTPFYSVLESVSILMALSTVFHSINSPDNSPFSDSVLPVLPLLYRSFQLYISSWKSPSVLI